MKRIITGFLAVLLLAAVFTSCSSQPASITMIDSTKTLTVGKTYTLQYNLTPPNSNEKLIWTSSDEEIATVENGTVTALKKGNTTIRVTTSTNLSAECQLEVKDIDITKISITPSSVSLKKGNTQALEAKIYPSAAEGAELVWDSSNTSVASVSADGIVTAESTGTATITATADNGKSGSATITVTAKKKKSSSTGGSTINYFIYSDAYRRIIRDYPDDFVFANSSDTYLSDYEVNSLSLSDTQKAINEIYARRGNIFSTAYWRNYFSRFSWYRPYKKISMADCNSIEKANLNKLIKHRDALR